MGTWSSEIGKFVKKDPNHGWLGKKIKNWFCKIGLCNLDKCKSDYHKRDIPNNCCDKDCGCHKEK